MNNTELGGNRATRTPLLGASLNELLGYTQGESPPTTSTGDKQPLYEELCPKYNDKDMAQEIERKCRYNAIRKHYIDVTSNIPEPVPIIQRYGSTVASLGNISAVVGAAKSKKTFLCTALVGALLRSHEETTLFGIRPQRTIVLWVDTEQSPSHVQRVVKRIHRLAGLDDTKPCEWLNTLTLREVEPKERFDILRDAIGYYRPRLVVVDGISDLMYNSNCIEESDAVVGELMALSTEYNCHIMNVLHANPNSDKARGHIGSTLQRKAETMIYVRKAGECSVVEPQFCRNEEFSPFAFCVDEEGLPEECSLPTSSDTSEEDICVKIIREGYPNGVERSVLTTKIEESGECSRPHARVKITRAIAKGTIVEKGGVLYLP